MLISVLVPSSDCHCSAWQGRSTANKPSNQAILNSTLTYYSWKLQPLYPQTVHGPLIFSEHQDKHWVQSLTELLLSNLTVYSVNCIITEWKVNSNACKLMENTLGRRQPTYPIHLLSVLPPSLPIFQQVKRKTFCKKKTFERKNSKAVYITALGNRGQ